MVHLELPEGSTVGDALALAQARNASLALLDLAGYVVGVWGEEVARTRALASLDRVEIYRPLEMDAKSARLQRAQRQKEQAQQGR